MESSSKQPALAAGRRSVPRPRHDRPLSPNELREYLDGLNEKDPSQLMGAVSQGNLLQGLVLATIAATVLLLACTIGPYAWDHHFGQAPLVGPQQPGLPQATWQHRAPRRTRCAASAARNEATSATDVRPLPDRPL